MRAVSVSFFWGGCSKKPAQAVSCFWGEHPRGAQPLTGSQGQAPGAPALRDPACGESGQPRRKENRKLGCWGQETLPWARGALGAAGPAALPPWACQGKEASCKLTVQGKGLWAGQHRHQNPVSMQGVKDGTPNRGLPLCRSV